MLFSRTLNLFSFFLFWIKKSYCFSWHDHVINLMNVAIETIDGSYSTHLCTRCMRNQSIFIKTNAVFWYIWYLLADCYNIKLKIKPLKMIVSQLCVSMIKHAKCTWFNICLSVYYYYEIIIFLIEGVFFQRILCYPNHFRFLVFNQRLIKEYKLNLWSMFKSFNTKIKLDTFVCKIFPNSKCISCL